MVNHKKRMSFFFSLFFFSFLLINSCSTGADSPSSDSKNDEKRIAVILPSNSDDEAQYKGIINWCLDNFRTARSRTDTHFNLKIDWYNEGSYHDEVEFKKLLNELAYDKDFCAVICLVEDSNYAAAAAKFCSQTEKPLIMPTFSSDELLRRYSVSSTGSIKRPFLWSITESDVTQCEVAMSKVLSLGMKSIAVLSSADTYGNTYYSWASFLAREMNLELKENIRFKYDGYSALKDSVQETPLALSDAIEKVMDSDADVVICAMRDAEEVKKLLWRQNERMEKGENFPELFFTDSCVTSSIVGLGNLVEGIEGTAAFIDPGNGFLTSYRQKFGSVPLRASAQLYDSILITIYALAYQSKHSEYFSDFLLMAKDENISRNIAMNEAYKKVCVTQGQNNINNSWDKTGMIYMLKSYDSENPPLIEGASGIISFDSEVFTTILYSTYVHWSINRGKIDILSYMSASGGRRTASVRADRAWTQTLEEITYEGQSPYNYPEKTEQYAVLVAASAGWKNYRHQADVLNMYKFLTNHGFDDDHIVMIMQNDIANNPENITDAGNVRVSPNGANLYTKEAQAGIDGKPSELLAEDIESILTGDLQALKGRHADFSEEKLKRLTFESNEKTNIFFFWTGHGELLESNGSSGQLLMSDPENWANGSHRKEGFTTALFKETLEKMTDRKRFRQFLVINESCHGKSVFKVGEGFNGVLVYTSANEFEPSFTDVRNVELDVWMTNRFTKNLMTYLYSNLDVTSTSRATYYDLYSSLAKQTLASHVCLINSKNFCNVNDITYIPADFFIYSPYEPF